MSGRRATSGSQRRAGRQPAGLVYRGLAPPLFSAAQHAILARLAGPEPPGPPESPRDRTRSGPARPSRPRPSRIRVPAGRMPAPVRVANYAQSGRARLTGRQLRRVMAKNMPGGTRQERRERALAVHRNLTAPVDSPAPRRVQVVESDLL